MKKFDIYNKAKTPFGELTEAHRKYMLKQFAKNVECCMQYGPHKGKWTPVGQASGWNVPFRVEEYAYDCIFRVRPPKKVFIHVHGGVAYCDRVPKGVIVKIIDHDNEGR
jgi:hypothetical protein